MDKFLNSDTTNDGVADPVTGAHVPRDMPEGSAVVSQNRANTTRFGSDLQAQNDALGDADDYGNAGS